MTDIVERIRNLRYVHVPVASQLMAEAAAEIERLRNDATCPHIRGTVTQHCSLNFTLTDAEREAIEWFSQLSYGEGGRVPTYANTLRKLLDRTNHDAVPEAKAYAGGEPAPKCGGEAGLSPRDGTGNTPRPVAWVRLYPNGCPQSVYLDRPPADAEPLYRSPTLTDEEREAVEWFAEVRKPLTRLTQSHNRENYKATLRGLLERTSHDAVPEAKARTDPSESSVPLGNGGGCGGIDKPVTLPAMGTGNLSEAEIDAIECVVEDGRIASMSVYGVMRSLLVRLRPEWESQPYEESDEQRTNTNMNWVEDEIAIEAAWDRTGLKPTWPEDEAGCGVKYATAMADEIERLRLTDDELDAIEHGLERLELHSDTESEQSAAALRSLLARLA